MALQSVLESIQPWALCRENGFEDVLVAPISSEFITTSFDSANVCPYEKIRRNISVDHACVSIRESIVKAIQDDANAGNHLPVGLVAKAMRYARVPSVVFVMVCLNILKNQHSVHTEQQVAQVLEMMRPLDVLRCAQSNIQLGLCVLCGTMLGDNIHQWTHDGAQLQAHIECLQSRVIRIQMAHIPSWAEWPIHAIKAAVFKVQYVGTDECVLNVQLRASPRVREVDDNCSADVTLVVCGSLTGCVDVWAKHKQDFLVVMDERHLCKLTREVAHCSLHTNHNQELWENLGMGDVDYKEHIKSALYKRQ